MTRSGRHSRAGKTREAAGGHEAGGQKEATERMILAVRLAVTAWELIQALVDHVTRGGPGRIV